MAPPGELRVKVDVVLLAVSVLSRVDVNRKTVPCFGSCHAECPFMELKSSLLAELS